jgi:hypothetical protein
MPSQARLNIPLRSLVALRPLLLSTLPLGGWVAITNCRHSLLVIADAHKHEHGKPNECQYDEQGEKPARTACAAGMARLLAV